jgi:hypothetical protein
MIENRSFKYFLLILLVNFFIEKIKLEIILREIDHLKLINPLELIYKDKSWQQQNKHYESVLSFNKLAKKLLHLTLKKSNKKISNTDTNKNKNLNILSFDNNQKTSYNTNEQFHYTELPSPKIETSSRDNLIENVTQVNDDILTSVNPTVSMNATSTLNPLNLVNLRRKCQEIESLKYAKESIKNESSPSLNYKCINCVGIKSSFECKKFEENEIREMVNVFCCECNSSEE